MKDNYGQGYNKSFRLGKWRYNVGVSPKYNGKGQTYYRPFLIGLRCWLKWNPFWIPQVIDKIKFFLIIRVRMHLR